MDTEFDENIINVGFDGTDGNHKLARNLLVRLTRCDIPQHFQFPLAKGCRGGRVQGGRVQSGRIQSGRVQGGGKPPYKYRFFTLGRGHVPACGVFVVFGAPFPFAFSSCSEVKVWAVSGAR